MKQNYLNQFPVERHPEQFEIAALENLGLIDCSWGNDEQPSWGIPHELPGGTDIWVCRFWIDTDESDHQYCLTGAGEYGGECPTIYEGNNWAAAIIATLKYLRHYLQDGEAIPCGVPNDLTIIRNGLTTEEREECAKHSEHYNGGEFGAFLQLVGSAEQCVETFDSAGEAVTYMSEVNELQNYYDENGYLDGSKS